MRHQYLSSLAAALVATALIALVPAEASTLSASLSLSGPLNDREWIIDITNSNPFALTGVEISAFNLIQTGGAAASPVIDTSLPISIGTIPIDSDVVEAIVIDFVGAADTATFDGTATLIGDGFTASILFSDVPVLCNPPTCSLPYPGTVSFTSTATPLPPSLVLFGSALLVLGLMRRQVRYLLTSGMLRDGAAPR